MNGFETDLRGVLGAETGVGSTQAPERATGPQIRPAVEVVDDLDGELLRGLHHLCGKKATRRLRIALAARNGQRLTDRQVMERFGCSRATAKRDRAAVRMLEAQP